MNHQRKATQVCSKPYLRGQVFDVEAGGLAVAGAAAKRRVPIPRPPIAVTAGGAAVGAPLLEALSRSQAEQSARLASHAALQRQQCRCPGCRTSWPDSCY